MNRNYEQENLIMGGAELLYSMLAELTDGIKSLPGCRVTENLKRIALDIETASSGILDTMRMIAADNEQCMKCSEADEQEAEEADIPLPGELEEFLNKISELISSDKPVSISADIYINENNDTHDEKSEVTE